jgi:DNA-binding transcriptional MerR regulator
MKIAEVSDKTGVSRELIHHYLRQELLPQSPTRGQYSDQQIRLLRQIKTLREDHHLPLEVIRGVFAFFGFEPGRIEALTQADSLSRRLTRLASAGDVLSSRTVTAEELLQELGITGDRLAEYQEARLVSPVVEEGGARYSSYDAKVISLCEHGVRLGMPFESLRTVGSYVRVAYELEHADLLSLAPDPTTDPDRVMADVVAGLEVITSFIQSLLQSLIARHIQDFHRPQSGERESLDALIYRPSAGFLRRHGLDRQQEDAARDLCDTPHRADGWQSTGRLLVHAGRYREAVFFLEQALERLGDETGLRPLYGQALVLAGYPARAAEELARYPADPLCAVYRVLLRFAGVAGPDLAAPHVPDAAHCAALLHDALTRIDDAPADRRYELQLLAGWLLTALPVAFRDTGRGQALLEQTLAALHADPAAGAGIPGLRQRYLINAAYLLLDARARDPRAPGVDLPTAESLRTLVCRLDPGCAFAEAVFLRDGLTRETP